MKEHYLRSVRGLLDCPPEERERLLSRLGDAITAYLEDVPESSEAELLANFGPPEDCAARLLEECAPAEIAVQRQKKVRRHRILTTALAVLLATALGIAGYLWLHGGLVIIQRGGTLPDSIKQGQVTYSYDD